MHPRRPRALALAGALIGAAALLAPSAALAQTSPSPAAADSGAPTSGAATPEAAIAAHVAGIAAGDVDAILAASAVDDAAQGFDFAAYTDRLQAMVLNAGMAPAEYPLFGEINRAQQAWLLLSQVRNLAYGLLSDEAIDGSVIAPVDPDRVAAFVAAVDPARLAGLTVLDSGFPDIGESARARYETLASEQAAVYGADELTERLALVELDGQTYGLGFTLLRYGDAWKVWSQSSALAGIPLFGTADPMTPEAFEDATE